MTEDYVDSSEDAYKALIDIVDLGDFSNEEALICLGHLIDLSFELGQPEGLQKALSLSAELQERVLAPEESATLHYFSSNAWANLHQLLMANTDQSWNWEQDEIAHQITYLRRALDNQGFSTLPLQRRCQILTNLGNTVDYIGRFVEAIEYWDRALALMPSFGMARGNRGLGISEYGRALHDRHDSIAFIREANGDLKAALTSSHLYEDARRSFATRQALIEEVEARIKEENHQLSQYTSIGSTKGEMRYRKWCLQNRLFLNHLNDIELTPNAARDNLILPPITTPLGEGLHYHGLFNQLKQEFVSARYLYFEGIEANEVHFSDKNVLLYNTLDYPSYSLAVEKVKAAFRISYSLFDKIAYFLNRYLDLSIKESQVTFKTCWYISRNREKGLRSEFLQRQNWPLRGLFWLSKDLFEDRLGFRDAIEPDAQQLAEIRQHLEHKYLKVHEFGRPAVSENEPLSFHDDLAFSVGRRELETKTLRLLKMIRAALIYLSLAIYSEERQKDQVEESTRIMPMELDSFDDGWKS
jgi:hypothetical protein